MKKIFLLLVSIFMLDAFQSNAQCEADFQFTTNNLTVNFQDSSFYSPNSFTNEYDSTINSQLLGIWVMWKP